VKRHYSYQYAVVKFYNQVPISLKCAMELGNVTNISVVLHTMETVISARFYPHICCNQQSEQCLLVL